MYYLNISVFPIFLSNMHYGFVGTKAGFSAQFLLDGADKAQVTDNSQAEQDDPVDKSSIREGFLLARKNTVKIDDFIEILRTHPEWLAFKTKKTIKLIIFLSK